jgi:hypothetical protein
VTFDGGGDPERSVIHSTVIRLALVTTVFQRFMNSKWTSQFPIAEFSKVQ